MLTNLASSAIQPLGSGGEVGVTGANADYKRQPSMRQLVWERCRRWVAQTAEVQLVIPKQQQTCRPGLANAMPKSLKRTLNIPCVPSGVTNAAAADQERICVFDDLDALVQSVNLVN